jgi:hypothetical protein
MRAKIAESWAMRGLGGLKLGAKFAKSWAMRRGNPQTLARHEREGRRKGSRHEWIGRFGSIPDRGFLREGLDDKSSERPDIGSGGCDPRGVFRRLAWVAGEGRPGGIGGMAKAVHGELQDLIDGHDVRRLETTMHEIALVKIGKRIEHGPEHLPGFLLGKWALGQDLGQNLLGVLSNDVEQRLAVKDAASKTEYPHQVRMGQSTGGFPTGDQESGVVTGIGEQLEDGFLRGSVSPFREEDAAPLGSGQPSEKRVPSVDGASDEIIARKCRAHGDSILAALDEVLRRAK